MVFEQMFLRVNRWPSYLTVMLGALLLTPAVFAQGKLYRYINEEGTKVISSSIPPRYVGRGYEILSPQGRVMQVIPPEPTAEDKAKVEEERAMLAEYELLARRYSSTRDIEAARDRRLANLDANIAVLRGNISNLNAQIEDQMSKAARFERGGQKVPAYIFNAIDELRAEVHSAERVLEERIVEYQDIYAKFADDVALFEKGKAIQVGRQTSNYDRE